MHSSHSLVQDLLFKKGIVVLFFMAWVFTALINPLSISTLLIPLLFVITTTYVFFCSRDYGVSIWIYLLFALFAINFLVNELDMNKESIRWLISFWCCLLSVYFLLKICGRHLILSIYKKLALIISVFCILQQLSFLVGVEFLYDLSWMGIDGRVTFAGPFLRVTAFFAEPAHLGFFLIYPCFLAIVKKSKATDYLILATYFMTFSIGNYLMLICLLIGYYLFIEKRVNLKSFLVLCVIGIAIVITSLYVPEVKEKLDSIFAVDDELWLPQNRSKLAIYLLYSVNLDSLSDSPFFGNGFGTRLDIYQKYFFDVFTDLKYPEKYISDDTFFAKILGEMGVFGLAVFFIVFFRRWLCAPNDSKVFLFVFLVVSLKSGSYFNPALFFFLNMYFFDGYCKSIDGTEDQFI